MLPALSFVVELPAMLDPAEGAGKSRVNQIHNACVKEAIRKTLIWYQTNLLHEHFEPGNKSKYQLHQRSKATQKRYQRKGHYELHLSGRTQTKMTQRAPKSLRVQGTAEGGRVSATMTFAFPFPVGKNKSGLRLRDLAQEIEQITPAHSRILAGKFREFYVELIKLRLKPRQRKRIAARLGELGLG